jgi:hypothetical protein
LNAHLLFCVDVMDGNREASCIPVQIRLVHAGS